MSAILLLLAFVAFLLYLWNRYHFSYWQRKGVQCIPSTPFVGNIKDLLLYRCCFGDQFKQLYNHVAAKNMPFVGIHVLHNHALLLRDTDLIKHVLVKDFKSFASRFETADPVGDVLGSLNLFFAKYEIWNDIHTIFTPLFAHGKVKNMYPLLQQVGYQLEHYLMRQLTDATSESFITEVKEMSASFTTDIIASLALGVSANSLQNPKAEFRQMCIEVNDPRPKRILHLFTMFFFPQLSTRMRTHLYSAEYERFMRDSITYVIEERLHSGGKRGDLIDIFINLKKEHSKANSLFGKSDFYVAQAAFLILAGFDTSSSTITFALYELAKAPHIQQKLRLELQQALADNNGDLSYEAINNMEYLRKVVSEVLRLYPPTSFLDRVCTQTQGYALKQWDSQFVIPKGMPVYISVLALHRDANLWPDPLHFDPERFSAENRKNHVPMSYLPFGSGPRGCIGSVLGLLEVKVGLVHILNNFSVSFCEQTLKEMKFHPKTFVLAADVGTYLKFSKKKLYDEHAKNEMKNMFNTSTVDA